MKKYNIMFTSHPDYSGNSKALFEYMKSKYKSLNICWTIYDDKNSDKLKENGIDFVVYGSKEFEDKMKNTDIVFFTHDELIRDKKEGQIFIYLGHGNGSKKFGRMIDANKLAKNDDEYLYLMKKNIDYIICSSELYRVLYNVMLEVDYNRILPLGTPRTEYINSKESIKNLELVCNKELGKYQKILMYLPTFRSGLGRTDDGTFSNNVLNIDEYDEHNLERYLKENNYLLIVKYHPYETNKNIKSNCENIIYLQEENLSNNLLSLTEILGAVDLVIADYSSAYSDFVAIDKPTCFLLNDLEDYKKSRGIIFNDIDFWCPGPYINNIDSFKIEIKKLLTDKKYYSEERKKYTKLVFEKNTKDISKNICKTIFNPSFKLEPKESKKSYDDLIEENNIYSRKLEETNRILEENNKKNNELYLEIEKQKALVYELSKNLETIYKSKSWKMLEKLRKVVRR